MNENNYRNIFINKFRDEKINVKIQKPVNGILKLTFGFKHDNNKDYNIEWVETYLKLREDGFLIKDYLIKYSDVKSIELIEPHLFSSGYIELYDYFDNYLQIKCNKNNLKLLFEIFHEKIDN